jgi:uncharacterized membrane protein
MIAKFIVAISAFYHILATVAAMMAVFQFARILRGEENHHPLWRHIFDWAEAHLWISGLMLLAVGIYVTGLDEYLANPKLWTKVSLVTLWAANSLCIKKTLRSAASGQRNLMFGTSIACLFYGTFLGVAKPLAYGVLPFPYFLAGFVLSIAIGTYGVSRLLRPMRLAS